MGMVAPQQRIASAFFVSWGEYGDVSRYAQERGVCRQWIYREAAALRNALVAEREANEELREQLRQENELRAGLEARLAQAVVIDAAKQEELACVGQARGVTLRDCRELLKVLICERALSVAELGRRTHAAGQKAIALLGVLDDMALRQKVREAAADEIYVKDAVLMVVEPESLCWLSGRLSGEVSGKTWERELAAVAEPRAGHARWRHELGERSSAGQRATRKGESTFSDRSRRSFSCVASWQRGYEQGQTASKQGVGRSRSGAEAIGRMLPAGAIREPRLQCVPGTPGKKQSRRWIAGKNVNSFGKRPSRRCN